MTFWLFMHFFCLPSLFHRKLWNKPRMTDQQRRYKIWFLPSIIKYEYENFPSWMSNEMLNMNLKKSHPKIKIWIWKSQRTKNVTTWEGNFREYENKIWFFFFVLTCNTSNTARSTVPHIFYHNYLIHFFWYFVVF